MRYWRIIARDPHRAATPVVVAAQMIAFAPAPARLRAGRRVYAIGDVHGCLDQLAALHRLVGEDVAARPVAAPLLLHIGDYVDRGRDSAGVVSLLAAGSPVAGVPVVNLMGNHERTMLDALAGDRAAGTDWLHQGGREALASWRIDPDGPRQAWRDAVPMAQLKFLRGLQLLHREDGYLFVHAGVRPAVPLDRQSSDDLLRIRQPFLTSEQDLGAVIVHGHTPAPIPTVRANRIGIDTGAVLGGRLTCAVLEDDQIGFMWV